MRLDISLRILVSSSEAASEPAPAALLADMMGREACQDDACDRTNQNKTRTGRKIVLATDQRQVEGNVLHYRHRDPKHLERIGQTQARRQLRHRHSDQTTGSEERQRERERKSTRNVAL
jgi:hypothetical protein